jgi:hypothetical protein
MMRQMGNAERRFTRRCPAPIRSRRLSAHRTSRAALSALSFGDALSWACRPRLSSFQRFAPFERLLGMDFLLHRRPLRKTPENSSPDQKLANLQGPAPVGSTKVQARPTLLRRIWKRVPTVNIRAPSFLGSTDLPEGTSRLQNDSENGRDPSDGRVHTMSASGPLGLLASAIGFSRSDCER